VETLNWRMAGLCFGTHDPDAWFPSNAARYAAAKAICNDCPVAGQCLAFALDHHERFGVWGGLTPEERTQLRRRERQRERRQNASVNAA
jgi:WhiB family transcriptional regulator, redox-sensing transcriptional regulator